jgi:membrane fusion protein, multidrug efflux system
MKKGLRITLTIIIVVLLLGLVLYPKFKPYIVSLLKPVTQQQPGRQMGGPMRQQQQRLNVVGYVIVPTHLSEFVNSTGTLRPDEEVDLSFETSGKIVKINFTEGARVKKGELLAKMNDKPLQAQLEKLTVQLKMAESKEFRQKSLLDRDAISKESYDQILTDVQSLQADINLIRARISETELRAPFDGVIGLRYLSEGSYATSATKIVRLVKTSPLKIEFSVSEKYTPELKIGYPIKFTVTDQVYDATVYAIDPKIDINTRTIVLRALYPNKNEELKPGRYTGVTLELSKIDNAVAIPTEAVISEMEGEKVFIFRKGRANSVTISIGLRTEAKVQITNGLNFGDTLLITGIMQLRQGLPVVLDTVITNK